MSYLQGSLNHLVTLLWHFVVGHLLNVVGREVKLSLSAVVPLPPVGVSREALRPNIAVIYSTSAQCVTSSHQPLMFLLTLWIRAPLLKVSSSDLMAL